MHHTGYPNYDRPFNRVVAIFFLVASLLSYDDALPRSIYLVCINLTFAVISFLSKHKRPYLSAIIQLLGGVANICGAQQAGFNKSLFATGGAILGAGVLWSALVLHRHYTYARARRVRLGDDEEASIIDEDDEAEICFESKASEDRAREVISEMIERIPPPRIEVQLQVERVERRD